MSNTELPSISRDLRNVLQTARKELFTHLQELRVHLENARKSGMDDLNATLQVSFSLVSDEFCPPPKQAGRNGVGQAEKSQLSRHRPAVQV